MILESGQILGVTVLADAGVSMSDSKALPPEMELLVILSKPVIEATDRARCADLANTSGFSWTHFIEAATFHGMRPVVIKNITKSFPDLMPEHEKELLLKWALQARKKTLEQLWLFRSISQRFVEERIECLLLKGPAMAELAYGSIFMREFVDFDVFVQKNKAGRAIALLHEIGFEPMAAPAVLPPVRELLKLCHAISLRNDRLEIDLHWELQPARALPIRPQMIEDNLFELKTFGTQIPTISPELSLIVGCVHASSGHWNKLCWTADVAHMATRVNLDWNKVATLARELRVTRSVLLGLELARRLMNVQLPAQFADEDASGLAEVAEDLIGSLPHLVPVALKTTRLASWKYSANLHGGIAFGIRAAAFHLFHPSLSDWHRFRLKPGLFCFYYVLHFGLQVQALWLKVRRMQTRTG